MPQTRFSGPSVRASVSGPHQSHGSEQRRLRHDAGSSEGFADSVLYYGLGQTALLTGPMLWFVFQSPGQRVDLATGAALGMCCLPLFVGLRRRGVLAVGRPWTGIDDVTLGNGGYRYWLGRGVFLATAFGGAAFGAAAVGSVTPATLPVVAAGVGVPLVAVTLYPYVDGISLRARLARVLPYAAVLVLSLPFSRPFDAAVGFAAAPLWFGLLVGIGPLDLVL